MTRKPPIDIYQQVTDSIVAAIEAQPGEYRMPWQRSGLGASLPRNAVTKAPYNGINILMCWCVAEARQYPTSLWATFKQWQQVGAKVRAGEKGTLIVFYKQYEVEPSGEDDDGQRLAARHSYVFNASQVDGFDIPTLQPMEPLQRSEAMQRLIGATGADVRIGGESAYYVPSLDYIQLPDDRCFRQTDAAERTYHFESTAGHELTHWAGGKTRLARDLSGRFGSDSYAFEELCAELGAAYLCAELGISSEPRSDHAQYLAHWLRVMKADKKAIFTAASKASEATRYLMGFMGKEVADAA
ncbi:MAG: ssDNA-binding domain-containing protein [Hyphomicrobium sp.]|jgi:antirestriction protein ArdC|uniref:ArdC family protein n=1 Tax=Hyphomicrobium sp. TaxID=82 RepID=UPI0025C68612|nr:zincin-like metallopeptidase domain-containing protein [Hyphomicrobium sp.]MBX9862389.1 ssDNA-binding domain-containing protein [Hyphomicrobium sp.]